MTQEEQDAVLGRTLREYKDATRDLAHLMEEAKNLGETLSRLGTQLQNDPEYISFNGVSHDARFATNPRKRGGSPYLTQADAPFNAPGVDGKRIVDLVAAIQNATLKVWDLARRLDSLGHKVV